MSTTTEESHNWCHFTGEFACHTALIFINILPLNDKTTAYLTL